MGLIDAVRGTGEIPGLDASRATKKRYSENLSRHLATELAEGLRQIGFDDTRPSRDGTGEKAFQGGLGSKKVDVSYSDERHGLLFAISVKTICFPEFGKNLKNRFGDMCTEAITLHMRFPYSVVTGLFAFPVDADRDDSGSRKISTFKRATKLFSSLTGRRQHTDAPEKFENFTMMLFQPVDPNEIEPSVKLFDSESGSEISEDEYFQCLRDIFTVRNPHMLLRDIE